MTSTMIIESSNIIAENKRWLLEVPNSVLTEEEHKRWLYLAKFIREDQTTTDETDETLAFMYFAVKFAVTKRGRFSNYIKEIQ